MQAARARLTKAAFIKQADQICAEANSAVDSLSAGTTSDQSFQVSQELDITRSELQSLQALTPPQENRATLNDFLTAMKNEVDALNRANTAVQSGGDTSSADAELASAKQNAESAATQYGMKDCGNAKSRHAVRWRRHDGGPDDHRGGPDDHPHGHHTGHAHHDSRTGSRARTGARPADRRDRWQQWRDRRQQWRDRRRDRQRRHRRLGRRHALARETHAAADSAQAPYRRA